ncbi:hypothetical protein [Roseiconus lacunae]|uniref:hypothetical protein n=1 Tax=Roseiconus lacunae TaxID=2605694 RepID=UPI0011F2ABFB|nr:hypothetical protein [Roseiconus lacunae]
MIQTHLDISKRMMERWSPFPNTQTLGSYCPFSQQITLHQCSEKELKSALAGEDETAGLRVLPLLAHELQHFVDNLGTLWGRQHLVKIFTAFKVRAECDLQNFHDVIGLVRALRRVDYNDYYTELLTAVSEPWDGNVWQYQFTCGLEIGPNGLPDKSRPLLFTQFATHSGAPVCRVPLSVASLLELRSVAAEIHRFQIVLDQLEKGMRVVEEKLWSKKMLETLYDPLLTKYTVAGHCLSNAFKIKDLINAFTIGSHIAGICLMASASAFDSLKVPLQILNTFGHRCDSFLKNRDPTFMYFVLVQHARDLAFEECVDVLEHLNAILSRSGLGSVTDVITNGVAAAHAIEAPRSEGMLGDRVEDIWRLSSGLIANAAFAHGDGLGRLPLPPILTADNEFFMADDSLNAGTFARSEDWHTESFRLYNLVVEFADAVIP